MSLIPDLSDIPDLVDVAPGEYDLRVIKAFTGKSQNTGRECITLVCEISGETNAKNVMHSIWLPMESDNEEKAAVMWRMIKEFTTALGLSGDLEIEDFEELQFTAILDLEESEEYGNRNNIKRVI
jgi:hypothetical protein